MRAATITLSAVIVLAIWLTTEFRATEPVGGAGLAVDSVGTAWREDNRAGSGATIATTGTSSTAQANDSSKIEPASRGRASTMPFRRTADPRLRGAFSEYLIESGLSDADSRKIADAAMAALGKCLSAVFGPGDVYQKGPAFQACNQNVLQEYGLLEAVDRFE